MGNKTGILLHISSFPNQYGIGSFGKEAYQFINFLKLAKQNIWQILPIHPTGFGDSPYQSLSVFALNPYFIDLNILVEKELLLADELIEYKRDSIDYGDLYNTRFNILKKAFNRFDLADKNYLSFLNKAKDWLNDYSLFMALKGHFNTPWYFWEDNLKNRNEETLIIYKDLLKDEINFYNFMQYEAYIQYQNLLKYAHKNKIKILGDLPIYLAYDSVDLWVNIDLFDLDENKKMKNVAGVPPDYFTALGQLWGNPLYLWETRKEKLFAFWFKRLKKAFSLYDYIRLDHFIGFYHYYAVDANRTDAKEGTFHPGPRMAFIKFLSKHFNKNKIIAEDLGVLNQDINSFIEKSKLIRMHVLQFAFSNESDNRYLPNNQTKFGVCYTGTHDNETTTSWLESIDDITKQQILKYTNSISTWDLIKLAYQSKSQITIIPWQDFLNEDNNSRMNEPGKQSAQWTYQTTNDSFNINLALKIKNMKKQNKKL